MNPTNQVTPRKGALDLRPSQLDYLLVDGSGSMINKWMQVVASVNGYVEAIKSRNLNSHVVVSVFDSKYIDWVQRDEPARDWRPSSLECPGGTTPLYDAINNMCRKLRDIAPKSCSIVIYTDGDNNNSHYTDEVQARALVEWCRAMGWQVTFIGCDFDNTDLARRLGGEPSTFISVQKGLLDQAGRNLGEKRARHLETGDDIGFSGDEKSRFGGYLAGPSK